MNAKHIRNNQRGLSLLELMIVIAIIGIIAAIGLPAYSDYARAAKRADAHKSLNQMAQLQERFFTDNNTYVTAADVDGAKNLGYGEVAPASVDGYWALSIVAPDLPLADDGTSYKLQAVPTGGHVDAECATITLDSTGLRSSTPAGNNCWSGK